LSRGTAIGLALGEPADIPDAGAGDPGPSPPGKRETEVAQLDVYDRTNKQIAAWMAHRTSLC